MRNIILGLTVIFVITVASLTAYKLIPKKPGTMSQFTPSLTESPRGGDEEAVTKIIHNFYSAYEDCMKNPPQEAFGKVGEYCQLNTGFTSVNFKDNLEKGGTAKKGADPIVCAQNFPESIKADSVVWVNENRATSSASDI